MGTVARMRRGSSLALRARRRTIVFDSFGGAYCDNPRAISEALHRRGAPVDDIWVADRGSRHVPAHARRVAPGSAEHIAALEAADAIVANDVLPYAFRKSPSTTYLQTWHGTPLKRIAFDVVDPWWPGSARHYDVDLGRDVARWDLLLSPNPWSSQILAGAFRYVGPVVETGYPRNDLLSHPERDRVRARVRAELGIADGVLTVLYLPTWRDGDYWSLDLDPDAVWRAFGERCVVVVRPHGLLLATGAYVAPHPSVRDGSHHADVAELYLAADVLVTDYSSGMFDFAVTGKPMVFYVHDLERYRDRLRGFYLDLEAYAPGPLVRTSEGVVAALANLEVVAIRYRRAYTSFRDRFCALEDGRAAERAADMLLERLAQRSTDVSRAVG